VLSWAGLLQHGPGQVVAAAPLVPGLSKSHSSLGAGPERILEQAEKEGAREGP